MRDIVIVLFIFGMVPVMIKRPWIGVMMSIWISVMNPHRFGWGFASELPVSAVSICATLIGMVFSRERFRLPLNATTFLLILLPLWMTVTLAFAFHVPEGFERWKSVMKVFFFILVTASVLKNRLHVDSLIWVLVFSVGFFGLKGGIFTVLTGGSSRVYGPPGDGYISDNNAIAVALVMIIPLAQYLALHAKQRWVKYALYATVGLSAIAVLGSQSRGAFLAVVAMSAFMWLKSRQKFALGLVVAALLPIAIVSMPDSWKDRMHTVETYEEDASAMGRINAWHMAFNVANDRPLIGGGFELYSEDTFARYAPDPEDVHAAHSIYFQMLGEHGYVGLLLLVSLGVCGWVNTRRIIRFARDKPEWGWAADLARAVQVSLLGFAVGGAFVNIAYWELQYYELLAVMIVWNLMRAPVSETSAVTRPTEVMKKAEVRA
jgi:putative inorganic carbon (HCO3(-)) transporter